MKRNDVIKALECCSAPVMNCDECPVDKKKKADCVCGVYVAGEALKVIKHYAEENERLKKPRYILKQDGDAKQLPNSDFVIFSNECIKIEPLPSVDQIRADTVRKMQDSIVIHFGTYTTEDTVRVLDVIRVIYRIGEELLNEGGG